MNLKSNKDFLTFLIALHAHQPVDNFDHVCAEAFDKSYIPFFNVLSGFPGIKISFHISGSLLDWALINEPDFISKLKELVKKGQVEILTSGYYEPILILLPEWDILGQIELHKSKMKELFRTTPVGLWLTERVWEPGLPKFLKKAGIKFTIVDDEHFKLAGYDVENLTGYYLTEDQANEVAVFPGSKFLRYAMPFKLAGETIDYLRLKLQEDKNCIVFADDIEKFGFWPKTYQWVYEREWLHNFFQALSESSSWLKTEHFKDILAQQKPAGRVYLPCASYSEMMEWSGNTFRNFLVKYPESNHLHKRMFNVSSSIQNRSSKFKNKLDEASLNLYKVQNNDVYWHGVFGGLYLTHLRHNAYRHLIKAEKILENAFNTKFPFYEVKDFDFDGRKEIIFKDSVFNIYIAPEAGGVITEIDYKPAEVNLLNTLSRRKELYHEKILRTCEIACSQNESGSPASIHDIQKESEFNAGDVVYDRYRKAAWIDHLYGENGSDVRSFSGNNTPDILSLWEEEYSYDILRNKITLSFASADLSVGKKLTVNANMLDFQYNIHNNIPDARFFSSEFNLLFYAPELITANRMMQVDKLLIEDEWFNLKYEILFSRGTAVFIYPIETISDSEAGVEKTYQGASLHFIWPLDEDRLDIRFQIKVEPR